MRALGVHRERLFSKFVSNLSKVRVVDKPHSRRASGFKHVYELTLTISPRRTSRASNLVLLEDARGARRLEHGRGGRDPGGRAQPRQILRYA